MCAHMSKKPEGPAPRCNVCNRILLFGPAHNCPGKPPELTVTINRNRQRAGKAAAEAVKAKKGPRRGPGSVRSPLPVVEDHLGRPIEPKIKRLVPAKDGVPQHWEERCPKCSAPVTRLIGGRDYRCECGHWIEKPISDKALKEKIQMARATMKKLTPHPDCPVCARRREKTAEAMRRKRGAGK